MKKSTLTVQDLQEFRQQLLEFIEKPSVILSDLSAIKRVLTATELAIELIQQDKKVSPNDRNLFEGSTFLIRYTDGWGAWIAEAYAKMATYIKRYHWR